MSDPLPFRLPRDVPDTRLDYIRLPEKRWPSQSTHLYNLLPFEMIAAPHQQSLLKLLAAGTSWELLAAAERIAARLAAASHDDAYFALRARYEELFGFPPADAQRPKRREAWNPVTPWADITAEDVRCCLVASGILLLRTRVYVAPSLLMAVWVWEGKRVRNRFLRPPFPELAPPPSTAIKPTMWFLRHNLRELLEADGVTFKNVLVDDRGTWPLTSALKNDLAAAFPNRLRTTFAEIIKDNPRSRWWAWSHTMPHFWSMDVAVARHPQRPHGLHLPPTRNGDNIRSWFRTWLSQLTKSNALTKADVTEVLTYSSTKNQAFRVETIAAATDDDSWWRIRVNPDEAARVVPLHLYLLGAYLLECKRRIADAARAPASKRAGAAASPVIDPAEIPDSAAYAAFNMTIDAVIGTGSRLEPKDLRQRYESRLGPKLHAQFLQDRLGASQFARINILRFLYVRDVLAPLMALPASG